MIQISRWQIGFVIAVVVLGVLYALPNFVSKDSLAGLPDWLPHRQVNLGLDLQGGSHLLLEVDLQAVVQEDMEALVDDVRVALRGARLGYTGLGAREGRVRFALRDAAQADQAQALIEDIQPGLVVDHDAQGRFQVAYDDDAREERLKQTVEQSIEIVRRRLDETGTREPTIQRQGDDRILVQLPGVDDPERIKDLLGKTAKLTFHMVDHDADLAAAQRGRVPPGSMLVDRAETDRQPGQPDQLVVQRRVSVGGETLEDSKPRFVEGQWVVTFTFDPRGAKRFADVTSNNVGRQLAILLDDEVVSAPVIRSPIVGGSGQIEGNFTVETANDLSILLRAGALPAPLTVIEERSVGPGLGADSIAAGKLAAIIGLVLVVVVMVVFYGRFGLMADAALLINMLLILAALSVLQATLTLPGIAGIVLTVGMAVDANVLVFERIREELRNGRTPISAVDQGYRLATRTIIDANLTTFIAAALLFQFGSGPVKGFAVTLAIGLLTSMFSAIMLTRVIVALWLRRTRPSRLPL